MLQAKLTALFCVATFVIGCGTEDAMGPGGTNQGGGPGSWKNEDVSCSTSKDCGKGEECAKGVCQLARCGEAYQSRAPMGESHYFGRDGELAIVRDATFVDAFEPAANALGSVDLAGLQALDVAGGNFDGKRPMGVAVAIGKYTKAILSTSKGKTELELGMLPSFVGAGDVDNDGLDELIAFGTDGAIRVCDVELGTCASAALEASAGLGKDMTVADVDGDGFQEPVFLVDAGGGKASLVVWNMDSDKTGQEKFKTLALALDVRSIAAGDLDGDGTAEIVLLEEGGWSNTVSDQLHVFSAATGAVVGTPTKVDMETVDVAVGDTNSDGKAEVVALYDYYDNIAAVFEAGAGGALVAKGQTKTPGQAVSRLAVVDWDGDSALGRLVAGPELVAGESIPLTVMYFPPYHRELSDGVSNVTLGDTKSTSQTHSDTVALHLGVMAGYGFETPVFTAEINAYLSKDHELTKEFSKSLSVGTSFYVEANPKDFGQDYGAVVLGCGCYHKYKYVTDDPASRIGGSGQEVTLFIPVGGQTLLTSTKRYNAMAKALGNLPIIDVKPRVGDPKSYPPVPLTFGNQPVAEADMVFPAIPGIQISDVGQAGFSLEVGSEQTNSVATTTTVGLNTAFGALGVTVELEAEIGVTKGYSVAVGQSASFEGMVPALPDDPTTPEDEFKLNRYSYTPYIYRERWGDAGFYVLNYAVGGD